MPETSCRCPYCGEMNHNDLHLRVLLGICIILMVILTVYASLDPRPTQITEWIAPHFEPAACLTWDEAKSRYSIEGEALMEYMINQECER